MLHANASKLLNFSRHITSMSQVEYLNFYNTIIDSDKEISSIEVISSFLGECLLPWPSSQADLNITRQNVAMPPTLT